MCGIAGGFWPINSAMANAHMTRSLDLMRNRGPDNRSYKEYVASEGSVFLGHARLSVIDLSGAAHQPMSWGNGRLEIVFNGEIYNYLELRTELEQCGKSFVTRSDTEVLLAAWDTWGPRALHRFIGMFSFALLDRDNQQIVVVRDGFGVKPLYYALDQDGFRFASELAALRALRTGSSSVNWQRAYDYLVHGEYDFGEDTFIDGIRTLLPGHMLTLSLKKLSIPKIQQWWSPKTQISSNATFKDATQELRELVLGNVRMHLRSDVPLGAALSGGLDSSAIVCAMRYLEPDADIHTFSFIATEASVSEESWVDLVNNHVGAKAHKIFITPEELAEDMDDLISSQGEPFGSTSIYAQYRVFKLANECGITVTLDGQGADELLGGYNGYPGQRIRSLLEDGHFVDAYQFLVSWSRWPGRDLFQGLKRVAGVYSEGALYNWLRHLDGMDNSPNWINPGPLHEAGVHLTIPTLPTIFSNSGRRMMDSLAASLCQRGLPALLRHGDRNSMRFSIESRVPFLTHQLADFTLGLPEDYLVSMQGESKHLLRAAMRGIVPDLVLDRRDKVGFATPEKFWILSMADTVREWLAEDTGLPFLNQVAICENFDKIVAGKLPYTWQVWRWINFIRWYKGLN